MVAGVVEALALSSLSLGRGRPFVERMTAARAPSESLIETVNRRIAARTMDGFKICARIALLFPRAVPLGEAESTLSAYVRAFAEAFEEQLSGGRLPCDDAAIHARITARVNALPRHHVRVTELHVATGAQSGERLGAVKSTPPETPHSLPPPETRRSAQPVSGFVMRQPESVKLGGGFTLALERATGHLNASQVGIVLARPLRDAAASLLLAALDAVKGSLEDPLMFVDGRAPRALRTALVAEATTCVAYLLLDSLIAMRIPQGVAVTVVEGATDGAVAGAAVTGPELSRYLALGNAAHALAEKLCCLLEVSEPPDLLQRLTPVLNSLRADTRLCAERLRARAVPSRR